MEGILKRFQPLGRMVGTGIRMPGFCSGMWNILMCVSVCTGRDAALQTIMWNA